MIGVSDLQVKVGEQFCGTNKTLCHKRIHLAAHRSLAGLGKTYLRDPAGRDMNNKGGLVKPIPWGVQPVAASQAQGPYKPSFFLCVPWRRPI